eukprot:scaffold332_cov117-Cylindrotheca_fusiformis.AAC.14
MPRGKNYVNANKGVALQGSSKAKTSMQLCEYGSGCNRPDCIYRHDSDSTNNKKSDEVCLPFLVGKCAFVAKDGCRKRHPKKEERERLLKKYKRTRCRFGDECFTESCLYLHPHEMEPNEPNYLVVVEPHDDVAFPPLNGGGNAPTKLPPNSAWKRSVVTPPTMTAPPPPPPSMVTTNPQQELLPSAWYPQGMEGGAPPPMCMPPYYPTTNNNDMLPMEEYYYYNGGGHGMMSPPIPPPAGQNTTAFNANAKEFIPGGQ